MTGPWLVSYIALWILFLIIVVVLISMLRNMGVLYQSMERLVTLLPNTSKLAVGEELPQVSLFDARGQQFEWQTLADMTIAFVVISPGCGPCEAVLEQLAHDGTQLDADLSIQVEKHVVISLGDTAATTKLLNDLDLHGKVVLLFDTREEVSKIWGITSTPTILLVDAQQRIVKQIFGAKLADPQSNGANTLGSWPFTNRMEDYIAADSREARRKVR
ncbi:MAG: TlpA family protein disulfide reductase [Candidatus Brachytrichaceae bacterium NZ_4S206]|jgi:thiol-disulfide isomerase/thioredoxin